MLETTLKISSNNQIYVLSRTYKTILTKSICVFLNRFRFFPKKTKNILNKKSTKKQKNIFSHKNHSQQKKKQKTHPFPDLKTVRCKSTFSTDA